MRVLPGMRAALLVAAVVFMFYGCSKKDSAPTSNKSADNWSFKKVSGDGQSVHAQDTLKNRLVVELLDGLGEPIFAQSIHFDITAGTGQVVAKPSTGSEAFEVITPTDWSGRAAVNYQNFGGRNAIVEAYVISRPALKVTFTVYSL